MAEIDYLFNGYLVAFKLTFKNSYGEIDGIYCSPFIFENCEDAFNNAIIQLSRK